MLSVVIPTMWKYEPFKVMLPFVINSPAVGQVILINNNRADTPDLPCFQDSKVLMIEQEKNLYVNPSWNLGVSLSAHDKVCLLSDDVILDPRLFIKADNFVSKDIGILGVCPGDTEKGQPAVTTGEIDIVEYEAITNNWAFGTCFFIAKENWRVIPEQLKIWFGDAFQWDSQIKENRRNYLATNIFYYSPQAVTVNTLTEPVNVDCVEDKFYRTLFG